MVCGGLVSQVRAGDKCQDLQDVRSDDDDSAGRMVICDDRTSDGEFC